MPLTTYFVRHGESQANVDRVFANRLGCSAPLTSVGLAQAETLTRALKSLPVTHVYTSPLARARQTAVAVANEFGVSCMAHDALCEYDVGDFEGESYAGEGAWRWPRYETVERAWRVGKHQARHPGGESLADLEARFMPFMESLAAEHGPTDVLVLVGHGGLYRAMLPRLLPGISTEYAWIHQLGHCDVVIAEYEEARWRCLHWGDVRLPRGR